MVGSILDILDGALARAGGKSTPFGAFIDSTTDRVGEGAMLGAIALVFARAGNDLRGRLTIAAVAGSFLVPYTRATAEALGLRGDVGLGSRAERVVVITAGLVLAPWGAAPVGDRTCSPPPLGSPSCSASCTSASNCSREEQMANAD